MPPGISHLRSLSAPANDRARTSTLFSLALLTLALVAMPMQSLAETEQETSEWVTLKVKAKSGANVRTKPSVESSVITALPKNTKLRGSGWEKNSAPSWTLVELEDERRGYVATHLLQRSEQGIVGPICFVATIIGFIWLYYKIFGGDRNKKCAWCGYKGIKFSSGEKGKRVWEYRNKDGSRDKRAKDNYQTASYFSKYACNRCNGITSFNHFMTKRPSSHVKVWKRVISKEGEGERKGSDWENKRAKSLDTSGANRKGDA